jgi:hypothetical protein
MTRMPFLPTIVAAALALSTVAAWAQDGGGRGGQGRQGHGDDNGRAVMQNDAPIARPMVAEPQSSRRPERNDALADSVRRIERSTRGEVISAERMQSDGRDVNRIKVMDARGRVRIYMDDPQERRPPPTRDHDN